MKQSKISINDAVKIASSRVLPKGYKPEDYLIVSDQIPLMIAKMIVKEAQHIMWLQDHSFDKIKR